MDLQLGIKKGMEKLHSLGLKEWGMVLIVGICCLVIVFPVADKKKKEKENVTEYEGVQEADKKTDDDFTGQMEQRLTELLSCVEDVGKVKVMVTVSGSTTKNILQEGSREREELVETDSAGGSRNSVSERSEGTTVFYDIEGASVPYILSEDYPEITGVVVIAEGSGSGTVDLDILNAVQVLFDVPAHKIKIMKMK